jgi:hypothetical protein
MSIFVRAIDRIFDFFLTGRKVKLCIYAEYRTACFLAPLLRKMAAETDEGETYRSNLIEWHKAERPPVAVYHGEVSSCRIDGPLQWIDSRSFPLGGLILSPGVTAHLNPFEARELQQHIRSVIEQAIVAWVTDHNLYDAPRPPEHFDRKKADRKAIAMLANWAVCKDDEQPACGFELEGSEHA